ncbi:hypothetical protein OG978_32550 [Streptomyces sp. NBC_01591]|uniref:hypothetical protein n=1 Tax=Streptomyces sp. NBC_01591 TaxID=2975888 RepID=UPI002DDA5E4C|nr:hypothetical protein [Streptomyces sp. NBC_01591]WSD71705.1 hypothetical protein OG978_32550 [Streptomyces sp. NBC_01591]
MRYTYRCDACRLTWDTHDDAWAAKADQKRHRRTHKGATPDDQIIENPGPLNHLSEAAWAGLDVTARAIIRGLRSKGFREAMESEWFRQAGMLLGTGVLILMVINWIIH